MLTNGLFCYNMNSTLPMSQLTELIVKTVQLKNTTMYASVCN